MDAIQSQQVFLQVQKFIFEYMFAIYKEAKQNGIELNIQYPFTVNLEECKQFIKAVLELHETEKKLITQAANTEKRQAPKKPKPKTSEKINIQSSNSIDNMDLSIFDQGKLAEGKSSRLNEVQPIKVVKPITINTFIKRIFKIRTIGGGKGSVASDAEYEMS